MSANLVVHAGGREATIEEVKAVITPAPAGRWHPVGHATVLDNVRETLLGAGYSIKAEKYALSKAGARFFGVLDLETPLAVGTALSVGVRNSIDKSFPIGFAAGSRVFVCDNLSFSAELMVRRKHTTNGMKNFGIAIGSAVAGLGSFKELEASRIGRLSAMDLTARDADHLILSAFKRGIINSHQIEAVISEWEKPRHDDFSPRNAWSLFNGFTEVLKPKAVTSPQSFVAATIRLNGLLLPEYTDWSPEACEGDYDHN